MSLILYIEHFSQPSRAVVSFCAQVGIKHLIQPVRLAKAENKTEEFLKISPFGTVPAMKHGEFCLYESHAIMTYLADQFAVDDHWYPKDTLERAKVNEYLHWHHGNIRFPLSTFLFNKYFGPKLYGHTENKAISEFAKEKQLKSLEFLNKILSVQYVAGTPKPTIADFSSYCEFSQYKIIEEDFSAYPSIYNWMKTLEKMPGIIEGHKTFTDLLPKVIANMKKTLP